MSCSGRPILGATATANGADDPCRRAGVLSCQQGFTLLELLAVLVIMGIITTFAVLSLGDRGPQEQMDRALQRLQRLVQLFGEEAVLNGRQNGVFFEERGYRFLTLKGKQWQEIEGDKVFRPRTLPGGMSLELEIDERALSLADRGKRQEAPTQTDEEKKEALLKPQVYLLSSGEATPFDLYLRDERAEGFYHLAGDLLGRLQREGPLQELP